MKSFTLREDVDLATGGLRSVIASVPLKHYACNSTGLGSGCMADQLVNMAEECFGHLLSGVGEGDEGGFEFDFPGHKEAASYESPPMTLEHHARHTARLFAALVNHPAWQIARDST